jgi:hypothetical protein
VSLSATLDLKLRGSAVVTAPSHETTAVSDRPKML